MHTAELHPITTEPAWCDDCQAWTALLTYSAIVDSDTLAIIGHQTTVHCPH